MANDGNSSTGWSAASNDTNAWWQVDLGAATSIDQVQVVTPSDLDQPNPHRVPDRALRTIRTSAANTTVARETVTIPDAGTASFSTGHDRTVRYVRVQKTDGQYFFIGDVRVLGAATSIEPGFATPTVGLDRLRHAHEPELGLVADVNNASTADRRAGRAVHRERWDEPAVAAQGRGMRALQHRQPQQRQAPRRQRSIDGHGSNIVQWTANGGSNQLWYFQATLTAPT